MSDKHYDMLVFGDTCVDLLMSGSNVVPQFGQVEKLVDDYGLEMGGSCCIFASQAARLGMRVALLGKVGADAFGQLIIDQLKDSGVDTRYIQVDPTLKTGITLSLSHGHDRAMLTYMGSLCALKPSDVQDELLASTRHLHYGSLFLHTGLLPGWVEILARARSFGASISLDTNWDPAEQWDARLAEAFQYIDILMPNEQEARFISHKPTLPEAITDLRGRVPLLALKRGEMGARLYTSTHEFSASVEPARPGGDSVGAGDSFDAGFVTGWLNALPLQACLEIGCACGRGVAGDVGGVHGQPYRHQIPALS